MFLWFTADAETTWSVRGPGLLKMVGNNLVVTYASPDHQPVTLVPDKPIDLPTGVNRIKTWFANTTGKSALVFLVKDGAGKIHSVKTTDSSLEGNRIDWDNKRKNEWPLWSQVESVSIRPPTESQIRERLRPEDAAKAIPLLWPKPLTLVGVDINPSGADEIWGGAFTKAKLDDVKSGKGEVWVLPPTWDTVQSKEADFYALLAERYRFYRNEPASFFPDDLSSLRSGPITYTISIHRGYNGPVIARLTGKADINREDPIALYAQKIPLPQLPVGKYIIDTKSYRSNGTLLDHYKFTYLVGESKADAPTPLPPHFDFATDQPMHVYPAETQEAKIKLLMDQTTLDGAKQAQVRLKVFDYTGKVILEDTKTPATEIDFTVPVAAGNDYFAEAVLASGDREIDATDLHFGVASPPLETPKGEIPKSVPTTHEFLDGHTHMNVEYRLPAPISTTYPYIEKVDYADLKLFAQQVKEIGSKTVSIKASWPYLEPLPGVFRFGMTDREVEAIRPSGVGIFLGYAPYASSIWAPHWLHILPFRTQDGDFLDNIDLVNPLAPEALSHWVEYWKRLAVHYYSDPSIYGYRTYNTPFEGGPLPSPHVVDYSPAAQTLFADWLKMQKREAKPLTPLLTLPEVKVEDLGPDLSQGWRDFVAFNSFTSYETTRQSLEAIRSIDPRRMIEVDRKSHPFAVEMSIPLLAKYGAIMKNEGSPGFREAALRSMAIQLGVPFDEELHRHIVTSRSIADATNYFATFLGNGTMWLTRWLPEHLQENYPQNFLKNLAPNIPYLKKTQPQWDAYLVGRFYEPKVLIVGSRAAELLGGSRRGFFADIAGTDVYSALFEWDQVPAHFADEYSTWVNFSKFPLVFAVGDILPLSTVTRLIDYAKTGGKLVLVGNVGDLVVEQPNGGNLLKKAVAHLPNVRSIPPPQRIAQTKTTSWDTPSAWGGDEVNKILKWAGVERPVQVTSPNPLGFQVQLRRDGENVVTIAVMRLYYGWYRGNIEFEDQLLKKFGTASGTASIHQLAPGKWTVEKLHRDPKPVGAFTTKNGTVEFPIDEAVAGEVQLYRLTHTK